MLRVILALLAAVLIVAAVTRSAPVWRAFWALAGLIAVYVVLKLTGVVDALAPSRTPWF